VKNGAPIDCWRMSIRYLRMIFPANPQNWKALQVRCRPARQRPIDADGRNRPSFLFGLEIRCWRHEPVQRGKDRRLTDTPGTFSGSEERQGHKSLTYNRLGVARPAGLEPATSWFVAQPVSELIHSRPWKYGVGCHVAWPREACKERLFWKTLQGLARGTARNL